MTRDESDVNAWGRFPYLGGEVLTQIDDHIMDLWFRQQRALAHRGARGEAEAAKLVRACAEAIQALEEWRAALARQGG